MVCATLASLPDEGCRGYFPDRALAYEYIIAREIKTVHPACK
jgi:hypothetical protein